ncbi:MAG: sigma-54 dependent transcriptional regulator [Desulfobacterales bacterium]|nr:sigma-54 dependent transcriptional regulator [Desulfobacterales bacterium]
MNSILVVSTDQNSIAAFRDAFGSTYSLTEARQLTDVLESLHTCHKDLIFIDIELLSVSDDRDGPIQGLQLIWKACATSEVVVMSSKDRIREAVKAVKAGARDYITHPVQPAEVKLVVENINKYTSIQSELDYLRKKLWQSDSRELVQTQNTDMKAVFERISLVAPTKTTVLLLGETGTGKGVLAKLMHRHSNRKDRQFISVHCGAIPDTLVESELFGHEKGSFTGAVRKKQGKFQIAHGGTIFLDEIGTLTPSAQIKLLQVLQDGTFQTVGGEKTLAVDVRVISATNVDLKSMCDEGQFRKDLYYRLNVFPILVPPLSKRIEDIPLLLDLFLKRLNRNGQKNIQAVEPAVMDAFNKYSWPGNIRELENMLERAYILAKSHMLTRQDFPGEIFESGLSPSMAPVDTSETLSEFRRRAIEVAEKSYLNELLVKHQGKLGKASVDAGVSSRQLHKLLSKYAIQKESFKAPSVSSKKQEL